MHVECAKSPNRLGELAEGVGRVGTHAKNENVLPFSAKFLDETMANDYSSDILIEYFATHLQLNSFSSIN